MINRVPNAVPSSRRRFATLGVAPRLLTVPLQHEEIACIDNVGDAVLIIVRLPHYQGAAPAIPYITIPLGIIGTPGCVVTVCRYAHRLPPT